MIAKKGINRYNFRTFDFRREMHVWVTGNGVTSAENRNESPSFNQKKSSQKKLTPQRRDFPIFQTKSLKLNRIKYSTAQAKSKKESFTSVRIESCSQRQLEFLKTK